VMMDEKAWAQVASTHGLGRDPVKAAEDPKGKKLILQRIEDALHDFPGYAKIRGVIVADEPWTVENGMLTPTLKKRRERILSLYQERIDALYGSKAPGSRQPR
jgi:long-chain acyl-CoA synthetase